MKITCHSQIRWAGNQRYHANEHLMRSDKPIEFRHCSVLQRTLAIKLFTQGAPVII
jgi:hypothetical protein